VPKIMQSDLGPKRATTASPSSPTRHNPALRINPHLHCMVPGGGISPDGTQWISCRPNFFLSVAVLARLFRRLFVDYLRQAFDAGDLQFFSSLEPLQVRDAFRRYITPIRKKDWVVYAKQPFVGPEEVLKYVARYTHRVAISNNRLLDISDGRVAFRWRIIVMAISIRR
jgi:hypothetical protein